MVDNHTNFAYSAIVTAPSPPTTGTSLIVSSGEGVLFPTAPFNVVIWPAGVQPLSTNAEIVRVTNVTGDTFTITREQEGTTAISIGVGDQISSSITVKTFTDIEENYVPHTFETVSNNLRVYPYTITYSSGDIDTIVYDLGGGMQIIKTFGYTSGDVTSITLSGDTPSGIDLVKTISYVGGVVDNIVYS